MTGQGYPFIRRNESLNTGSDRYKVYDLDKKLLKEISAKKEANLQGHTTASPGLGMDNLHVMDFLDAIKPNRPPN